MYAKSAAFALIVVATLSGRAWADADSDFIDCVGTVIIEQGNSPECPTVHDVRAKVNETCAPQIEALVDGAKNSGLNEQAVGIFRQMTDDRVAKLVDGMIPNMRANNSCD